MSYVLALYLILATGPQLLGVATADGVTALKFESLAACEKALKEQEPIVREAIKDTAPPDVKGFELKCEKA